MIATAAIADWAASTPLIDGVLFGSSDGEVEGPPVCAVAVARGFSGYGKGHTQSQALLSALGEALELYSSSRPDATRLIRMPFAEIAAQAFDPRSLCLYSEEQYSRRSFPFRPFDPRQPLHWIQGRWLDTGEPVYLPAFAVCLSDRFAGEALCQVTSNGLGAGLSHNAAVEHAVLELYERDAFLLSWLALTPKCKLDPCDLPEEAVNLLLHLKARGGETEIYLLTEDEPACVAVCVAIGDGIRWPAFTLGLGAARNRRGACGKAILELGQTSPFLARLWRRREVSVPAVPEDIKILHDHALYYCDLAHRAEFERWRSSPLGLLESDRAGVRIAAVDLTPPELQDDGPFHVVRAIARGLQPIHCGYGLERLHCDRLTRLSADRALNPAPCPIF